MPVYQNRQGKGLWIVFKYVNGELDTGSYGGSYARKPPARTYNTVGHAKAQWNRFIKDGYGSRVAEIVLGEDGVPVISWCDDEWTPNVEMIGAHARQDWEAERRALDVLHLLDIAKRDPIR